MKIIKTVTALRKFLAPARSDGARIGFVPTMGYFHDGHLSLMRASVRDNDLTVVSLFVNPLQFGPGEDFSRYPRDLGADARKAAAAGVDVLFCPSAGEVYPEDIRTFVEVPQMSSRLCGASRPGHFRGVATVVAKLVNMVQPGIMYLGQKDAQQAAILRKMLYDLHFPLKVRVLPTVREADGLAMSSRNVYLLPSERSQSPVIFRSLTMARALVAHGESDAGKIISKIKKLIVEETSASIEYVSCVEPKELVPVRRIKGQVLFVVAVRFSSARLIDNMLAAPRAPVNEASKR
jgi:pantoate--beta-alanine ligase